MSGARRRSGSTIPDPVARSRGVDWRALEALGTTHLVTDSRQVVPGDTFVAYPGEALDGRKFIPQAIDRGAASVLWERKSFRWNPAWRAKNLPIDDLKRHAGEIAGEVYGRPSRRLWMVGITGTNGKTSCSHWVAQSLTRLRRRCGVVGTLGSGWPRKLEPLGNTTPDAVWLHGRLRDFLRQRTRAVSMEVSSHGLAQDRVSGVEFDVALLTNLTRDHLDYHGTMRSYRSAKARLFRFESLKYAVLNLDDAFGADLVAPTQRRGVQTLGYGFGRARPAALKGCRTARVIGRNLRMDAEGLGFDVVTPWGRSRVESTLIGRFNAANLLGTLAVLLASDCALDDSVLALGKVTPVPGRAERFGGGRQPLVVVDYAHTPDALENVLETLRELMGPARSRAGKLVCVFGCGGDRDRGKRPLMGRIATELADEVIVTSDNPRSENPDAIVADILEGVTRTCAVVLDRASAIDGAVRGAGAADVVLVAGKGHEDYQEVCGVRHPFSDAAVVRSGLARRIR